MNRANPFNTGATLPLVFVVTLVVLLYPTLVALHQRWLSGAIEYGYLVVIMAAYVAYRWLLRKPIKISRGKWPWLAAFLPLLMAIFIADLVGIGLVPQLIFPVFIFVSIGLLAGKDLASRFLLPLLFLYFTIPFWQGFEYIGLSGIPLNEILRQMTVVVVSAAVNLSGIPAFIDGDFIVLPTGVIEIAEGCSGRAYFITAFELSVFYALAFLQTGRNRLILIVVASCQALIGNWIRVFALTMIGYFSEMQHPLVEDHGDFGWVVFCITTLPFVFIGRWLEGKEEGASHDGKFSIAAIDQRPGLWVAMATGCVIAVLLIEGGIRYAGSALLPLDWDDLNLVAKERCLGVWPEDSRPVYSTAASSWSTSCNIDGTSVRVFVADYPFQSQGQEAIHFDNQPVPSGTVYRRSTQRLDRAAGQPPIRFRVIESGSERNRRMTWVSYTIAGASASGNLNAKALQLKGLLAGRLDAQVYVMAADCRDTCTAAETALQKFANDNIDDLIAVARQRE